MDSEPLSPADNPDERARRLAIIGDAWRTVFGMDDDEDIEDEQ
jgi:hypothetical protein